MKKQTMQELGNAYLAKMEREIKQDRRLYKNPRIPFAGVQLKERDKIVDSPRCYSGIRQKEKVLSFFFDNISILECIEFHFLNGTKIIVR